MDHATLAREAYYSRVRPDVLALVPAGSEKVLDVGGGTGANVAHLKQMTVARFGVLVDLVAGECHPEVDAAYEGDLEDPALLRRVGAETGPFDAILCLDVLEHLKDPWLTIQECHKLLKPSGVIVASIPNARNLGFTLPLLINGRLDYVDSGILDRTHLRWFTRTSAIELMTNSGLRLEHIEGRIYGRKKRAFNAATFSVFSDFLFLQYYIKVGRS